MLPDLSGDLGWALDAVVLWSFVALEVRDGAPPDSTPGGRQGLDAPQGCTWSAARIGLHRARVRAAAKSARLRLSTRMDPNIMSTGITAIGEGFWNIRGSFRIAGLVDIGTHISLIRRGNGKFVFLDSYTLSAAQAQAIDELTGGGKKIEAILNLHPFHTVHVRAMHERYPQAKLVGTARHLERFPELPWEKLRSEDTKLHARYADDLDFSVPRGVDFISDNPNVHFSSVLALHRASRTIHVDDTLMYLRLPLPLRLLGMPDTLSFHPTLAAALEKHTGAAQQFRAWAEELIERWKSAENLCAAHTAALTDAGNRGGSIHARMLKALRKADATLRKHERKYG
jgi:hypothetical protein